MGPRQKLSVRGTDVETESQTGIQIPLCLAIAEGWLLGWEFEDAVPSVFNSRGQGERR